MFDPIFFNQIYFRPKTFTKKFVCTQKNSQPKSFVNPQKFLAQYFLKMFLLKLFWPGSGKKFKWEKVWVELNLTIFKKKSFWTDVFSLALASPLMFNKLSQPNLNLRRSWEWPHNGLEPTPPTETFKALPGNLHRKVIFGMQPYFDPTRRNM